MANLQGRLKAGYSQDWLPHKGLTGGRRHKAITCPTENRHSCPKRKTGPKLIRKLFWFWWSNDVR
jgi:hypothetical protein